MSKLQVGVYNRALDFIGVQVGVINQVERISGLQIGLLNVAKGKNDASTSFIPLARFRTQF